MKHVLFTKIAMRMPEGPRTKYESRDGWLNYRMKLFRKYCLPSVQAQTFKNFDWYFIAHPEFKDIDKYVKELEGYGKMFWLEAFWNEVQPEVGALLNSNYTGRISSTKIDSDDIIANSFMEKIVQHVDLKWLSFPEGYIMKGNEAAPRLWRKNPFLTLIEDPPYKSVFWVGHIHALKTGPFSLIEGPGWVQVDHGDNIKNFAYDKVKNFDEVKFSADKLREYFTWI